MKKHILLTTTAMLLSAITLNANAEPSNSVRLQVGASFIAPFEMVAEQYLGFGVILADEGGKKVVVDTTGALDEGQTTATMMSTASFHSYENHGDGEAMYLGSLNEGLIRVKNILADNFSKTPDIYMINVNDNEPIELTVRGGIKCGVVSGWNAEVEEAGNDLLIHVGGTLETADLRGQNTMLACSGAATVTLVINEDTLTDLAEDAMTQ